MDILLESLLSNKIFEDEFDDVFQPMPMEEFLKHLTSQKGWSQNSDGSWDVKGDVSFYGMKLKKLPLRFGKVTGDFECSFNELTTFEDFPIYIGGSLDCMTNLLSSLKGFPKRVGRSIYIGSNELTSLKGSPRMVRGDFSCESNRLRTLEGAPEKIAEYFSCSGNQLTTLEGGPKEVGGTYYASSNDLISLKGAPKYVGGRGWKLQANPVSPEELLKTLENPGNEK